MLQPKTLIIAGFLAATPIAVGAVATLTGLASAPAAAIDVIGFDRKWLLSVDEARALIASGALVIDARNAELRAQAPIRNAQPLSPADLAGSDGENRGQRHGNGRGEVHEGGKGGDCFDAGHGAGSFERLRCS